jgi:hypothetical protein
MNPQQKYVDSSAGVIFWHDLSLNVIFSRLNALLLTLDTVVSRHKLSVVLTEHSCESSMNTVACSGLFGRTTSLQRTAISSLMLQCLVLQTVKCKWLSMPAILSLLSQFACMQIMDQIEGRNGKQLPWEGEGLSAEQKKCLGVCRDSLMMLLSRDPSMRPSMEQLYGDCEALLTGGM